MQATGLRRAMISNAVFSAVSGLTLVIFGGSVARLVGIGVPIVYQVIGVGLVAFATVVTWVGTRERIDTLLVAAISIADFAWVVSSFVLMASFFFKINIFGIGLILGVAGFVLSFGMLQLQGIESAYAVKGKPHTHALCVSVDTPAPPDAMWHIIADLQSIHRYASNLDRVVLRDGASPGVDAVRQCTDVMGKTWGEHCVRYDEATRNVEFEFLADEPGFPFPFGTMRGGWEVVPSGAGSTVNIRFEVTPRFGIAHPIILALTERNLADTFGDVVAHMSADARGESPDEPSAVVSRVLRCGATAE